MTRFRGKRKQEDAEERRKRRSLVGEKIRPSEPDVDQRAEFVELYKILVQSSESLVARRQNVNTFFVTANGFLLSAVALVAKDGVPGRRIAIAVIIMSLVGVILSLIWRQLLLSFGQLNAGKFMVINEMEKYLAAPIFDAEWVALAEGRERRVYRSFTNNEARVPLAIFCVYVLLLAGAIAVAVGWLHIAA